MPSGGDRWRLYSLATSSHRETNQLATCLTPLAANMSALAPPKKETATKRNEWLRL